MSALEYYVEMREEWLKKRLDSWAQKWPDRPKDERMALLESLHSQMWEISVCKFISKLQKKSALAGYLTSSDKEIRKFAELRYLELSTPVCSDEKESV
jgi:hypothetical protein